MTDCQYEKTRNEMKNLKKSDSFKSMISKIEKQLGRKLSRVEQDLIAIDCLESIDMNTGKLDELKKHGVKI